MKKANIVLILLFCFVQSVHASDLPYNNRPPYGFNVESNNFDPNNLPTYDFGDESEKLPEARFEMKPTEDGYFWQNKNHQHLILMGAGVIVGALIGMGIEHYKNNNQLMLELEISKMEQKKHEKEKAEQKIAFHCIDGIRRLTEEFKSIQEAYPKPEQYNDVQQKQILEMMLASVGSVTKFEDKISLYTEQYNKLDPATALLNQQLLTDLNWLKRLLNTNKFATVKKEQEIQEAFAYAKRQAEVTKVEAEAKMTKNLEDATRDTKEHVRKTIRNVNRITQATVDQQHILESAFNRGLAALRNEQATFNSAAHKENIAEIKKLYELLLTLQKNMVTMQKETAELKQSLQQPTYPDTIQAPTSDLYPPLYNTAPPAYNPDWKPSQPTSIPANG